MDLNEIISERTEYRNMMEDLIKTGDLMLVPLDSVKQGRGVFSVLSLSIMLYDGMAYCALMLDNESIKSIFKGDFVRIVSTANEGMGIFLEGTILDKNITGFVLLQVYMSTNPQYYPKEVLEKMASVSISGNLAGESFRNAFKILLKY